MITHAMEDYLKTVYLLQEGQEKVSTSAIAQQNGCFCRISHRYDPKVGKRWGC